jgi:hypothetical protein
MKYSAGDRVTGCWGDGVVVEVVYYTARLSILKVKFYHAYVIDQWCLSTEVQPTKTTVLKAYFNAV